MTSIRAGLGKDEAAPVCAFILIHGAVGYYEAGSQSVRSLLEFSDLDIFVATADEHPLDIPSSSRITRHVIQPSAGSDRAARFLLKFIGLYRCLQEKKATEFLVLDCDALLAKPLVGAEIRELLKERSLAMTEQTTIRDSHYTRSEFLTHYVTHSLAFIDPALSPPSLSQFRFYNSGVVFATRDMLARLCAWALPLIQANAGSHTVGEHMIADQDYFQVWANTRYPGSCAELPWYWNHCEHWDEGFPRSEARILHFSNFCLGPKLSTLRRMSDVRVAGDWSFILVSYNSGAVLSRCLEEIVQSGGRRENIVVVDNCSTDNSREVAQAAGAKVIALPSNLGFGAAANIGVQHSSRSRLCFINPDCCISRKVLRCARAILIENPESCVCPMILQPSSGVISGSQPGYSRLKLLFDVVEGNYRSPTLHRFLGFFKRLVAYHDRRWSWPLGACFFTTRGVFERIGGFDRRYFLYMEDVELGVALRHHGIPVLSIEEEVVHFAQTGSAVNKQIRKLHLNKARVDFARHHYGWWYAHLLKLILVFARRVCPVAKPV